jgi:outer membrane protein assembly factor BamB
VLGADWSQWGGTCYKNMISDENGLPESFEPGKKRPGGGIDLATTENVKWTARLGSNAYGNPTVADGRVFVGTDDLTVEDDSRFKRSRGGLVKCLDEATGELVWQLVIPERKWGLPKGFHFGHQHLGVCSSPTVEDDRIYVVTSAGDVVCLDINGQADGNDGPFEKEGQYMVGPGKSPVELTPKDGDIVWQYDMITEIRVCPHDAASCSILVHGDMLYTSTSNGVGGAHNKCVSPEAPSFIVLDKRTGKLVAFDNEGIGNRMWHAQWSSPSLGEVAGKTLVFFGGGDGICYAFEAVTDAREEPIHLKKVWSYDGNPPHYRFRDGKPIPYYEGDKRKKYSTNKNDGRYVGPSQIIATPVFHEDRIYVPIGQDPAHGRGKGMLHCIDATKTGDITKTGCIWTYDGMDRSISTVAVADGLVYAADIAGRIHCLDADTGACHWVYDAGAETWGGPLVADGKLYFGTKRHFFVMAEGREADVLSKTYLGSPVYSTPIAANGVLYVASQRYLWAVCQNP